VGSRWIGACGPTRRAGSWFHERSASALTVATRAEPVDVDLGVIETEGKRITGFREKPQLDYEASLGIYVTTTAL
jgi:NDP-sugar pyrophosphorylase family protein